MFFLPLPLKKTLDTLHQVNLSGKRETVLPDPELYIIVNGKPTKSKIVWHSLVNVAHINTAVHKLKEINWLYGEVDNDSVDEVYKKVIEITNSATSRMLAKASESDVSGFQAFTVRNLDNKLSTDSSLQRLSATVCKLIISSPREGAWEKRRQRWKRSEEGETSNHKC